MKVNIWKSHEKKKNPNNKEVLSLHLDDQMFSFTFRSWAVKPKSKRTKSAHVQTLIYTDLMWRLIEVALVLLTWTWPVSAEETWIFLCRVHPVNLTRCSSWKFQTHSLLFCNSLSSLWVCWSYIPHKLLSYSLSSLPVDFCSHPAPAHRQC